MSTVENHVGRHSVPFVDKFKTSVGFAVGALALAGAAAALLSLHPSELWLYGSAVAGAIAGFISAGVAKPSEG